MIIGAPVDHSIGGELSLVAAVRVHGPDFRAVAVRVETAPQYLGALCVIERASIVTGRKGQLLHVAAVCVHDVQIHEIGGVIVEQTLLYLTQRAGIGLTIRCKQNGAPVRRIRTLGVIAGRLSQINEIAAVAVSGVDLVGRIIIPAVGAGFSAGSDRQFFSLFCQCIRIFVGRRVHDPVQSRVNPGTSRQPNAC